VATGVLTSVSADEAETVFAHRTLPSENSVATAGLAASPPVRHQAPDTTGLPGSSGGRPKELIGPLEVGQQFGSRYHILKILGIGGMGAVYQAWDAELGVAVALKVIRPEATRDATTAQDIEHRFKQELLLARQVTHKNVVRIHDLGELNGIKYITMPYIKGADLATVLRDERLTVPRVVALARQIASGLQAAHEAGVVHRDLKPANVMIESDHAIIMDFGIARSSSRVGTATAAPAMTASQLSASLDDAATVAAATMAGAIIGTIEYMAPEQARGEPVDQRADVYAFGLIVYDMLVGRRRSEHAMSASDELQKRLSNAPPSVRSIVPDVPQALDELVTRCTEPDAGKRFQTTAELVAALDLLDDSGKLRPVKRVVRLPFALAAVTVLLAASVGVWWYQRQFIPPPVHDPVSVVIADLDNRTNDAAFNRTLEPMLRRALEGASFIAAYDRTRLGGLGVQAPEQLDEKAAREVALKQGVGVVVSGSLEPQRSGYKISVKAIQTVTGNVVTNASATAAGKDQVLEVATRLMTRVRSALGDETSQSAQLFAMRSVSTSSLEVVGHYAAAIEAQARGKFEEARESYLAAVKLDPKFALGYQGLAAMSRNLDRTEDADKYIKEAIRFLDGLTEREKFSTRAYYYRINGNNPECVKEYGELLARYPADIVAHNQRAICLKNLRLMRNATNEMQQAVQTLPNHVVLRTNLALFSDFAGDFAAAEEAFNLIAEPPRTALAALAYSYLGRENLPEATKTYEKLSTKDVRSASLSASGLGDLLVYQGRFSDAVQMFERGAAADLTAKSPERAAMKLTSVAYSHLMSGRKQAAVAAAEKALEQSTSVPIRFLAASTFVEAGAFDQAGLQVAALSSGPSAEAQAHGKIIEGQIALKRGKPTDAVKILTDSIAVLDTWLAHFDLGRAYLAAGMLVQADSEFDTCIRRRGEALALMDDEEPTYGRFPVVYYYQGRVRESLKTAGFTDSYGEYLKIRGQSTEDPLLPDIRRRTGH